MMRHTIEASEKPILNLPARAPRFVRPEKSGKRIALAIDARFR